MNCLDTFYIAHFEIRDNFIWAVEKGLLLDKAKFFEKGYKIDKGRFSHNLDKLALSSGKEEKKVDDLINIFDDD